MRDSNINYTTQSNGEPCGVVNGESNLINAIHIF